MTRPTRRTLLRLLLALIAVGALGAAGGFVIGLRWPLEGLEERLGLRTNRFALDWRTLAETEVPRYENTRVQVGSDLYLIGGFYRIRPGTFEPDATARVEVLDLETGAIERRGDMPVALTHGMGALVGDSIWIAGGFVGDHPGPATDEVWVYHLSSDQWTPGPPLPAARGGGALVARGDTLHFFGGYLPDRNTDSPDHWTLVVGDAAWTAAPALPLPRGHLAAVVLDGDIYALSGNQGHDPVPADQRAVHRFDPDSGRWSESVPLPFPFSHAEPATMVYEGGILMVGGRARTEGRENLDDLIWFDPDAGRWIHLGRSPIALLGATAAVLGDSLVLGWGAEFGNVPQNREFWKTPLRDAWRFADTLPLALAGAGSTVAHGRLYLVGEGSTATLAYDLAAGRWTRDGADRLAPGGDHGVEVVDGALYLVGGLGRNAEGLVQIRDSASGEWRLGVSLPEPAGAVATATLDGVIHAAGGRVGDGPTSMAAALRSDAEGWRALPPLPRARSHASGGTDGGRFFLFGGRDATGAPTTDVQIYDPVADRWTVSDGSAGAPSPLPEARAGAGRAVYLDGEFWLIGGEGPSGVSARVDLYDPVANAWRRGPDLPTARTGAAPAVDAGRILVAGGRDRDREATPAFEVIWPRR